MATYKHGQYLQQNNSDAFDQENPPGHAAPFSGIYRCMGCGREIASNEKQPLPPQNHHQHGQHQGSIRWKLITYADHQPK